MDSAELKENEIGRKFLEEGNNQPSMKLRYIVVNSRLYEIFEDEPSIKVCRA